MQALTSLCQRNLPTGMRSMLMKSLASGWWLTSDTMAVRPISTTSTVCAEPMKKKKRLDPSVQRARDARKTRKLEKEIRKLEKITKQFKPLDELQVPAVIKDNYRERIRRLPAISSAEAERRWILQLDMLKFKREQVERECKFIDQLQESQERALSELRNESEQLYLAAVSMDESMLPYRATGPVETPPVKAYASPEGDYIDVSRKWEG